MLIYSPPSVSMGDWFQNPHGYLNPWMLKSLMSNGTVFAYNLLTISPML